MIITNTAAKVQEPLAWSYCRGSCHLFTSIDTISTIQENSSWLLLTYQAGNGNELFKGWRRNNIVHVAVEDYVYTDQMFLQDWLMTGVSAPREKVLETEQLSAYKWRAACNNSFWKLVSLHVPLWSLSQPVKFSCTPMITHVHLSLFLICTDYLADVTRSYHILYSLYC